MDSTSSPPDTTAMSEQQQPTPQKQITQSPVSKRRKVEHKVVVTVRVDDSSGKHKADGPPSDFWSWRKYGQKPIKGSPYPRGYYRCSTSKGCSAKKQVERCRTDASLLIVTYTSSHNHAGPDLHHISSSATAEHLPLCGIEREELPAPSANPGHTNQHHAGSTSNTGQTSCSATEAGNELLDNCSHGLAPHPNLSEDQADAGRDRLQQLSCSVREAEDESLENHDAGVTPNTRSSNHVHEGVQLPQATSSTATPAVDKKSASCNSVETSTPSSADVSDSSEAEAEVSENPKSQEAPRYKPPTTSPICEAEHPNLRMKEEEGEVPSPLSLLKHSTEGNLTVEKEADAESNHTPQSEEVSFDEGAVALPSDQTVLSPDEFDFYDELEELPTISPGTSIVMGSFFDERILLPS